MTGYDIKDSDHNSGWLSPNGDFYPCHPFGHLSLVTDLCEEGIVEENDEELLEKLGWVKIKGGRIFYFSDMKPTCHAVSALFDYMTARRMEEIQVNGDRITLDEMINLEWPLAMWKEIF